MVFLTSRTTLQNLLGNVQSGAKPGPPTVLTMEAEEEIVKWTMKMSEVVELELAFYYVPRLLIDRAPGMAQLPTYILV